MKPSHIHLPADCRAVSDVLARVGDKWSVLVVSRLGDGLITRTAFATIPPRVDYALTPLGRDLLVPVSALGAWAIRNQPKIARAREAFDGNCVANGKPPIGRGGKRSGLVQSASGT